MKSLAKPRGGMVIVVQESREVPGQAGWGGDCLAKRGGVVIVVLESCEEPV